MKKEFNVKGTKFTVNVEVEAKDLYDTIQDDYKKLLFLLGEASKIGAKLDKDFYCRDIMIAKREQILEATEPGKLRQENLELNDVVNPLQPLNFNSYQKKQALETLKYTINWYTDLQRKLENL